MERRSNGHVNRPLQRPAREASSWKPLSLRAIQLFHGAVRYHQCYVRARAVARLGMAPAASMPWTRRPQMPWSPAAARKLPPVWSLHQLQQCRRLGHQRKLLRHGNEHQRSGQLSIVRVAAQSHPTTGAAAVSDLWRICRPAVGACNHTNYLLDAPRPPLIPESIAVGSRSRAAEPSLNQACIS